MSGNLPNAEDISVDEVVNLIQNMPEEKRQKIISQISSGDIGGDMGL